MMPANKSKNIANARLLKDLESLAKEFYQENYERLKFDGGHALNYQTQKTGLMQVIMYLHKSLHIAQSVTDTEVKLILPNEKLPDGSKYSIVGVIDIVKEKDSVTLYDIKTHDLDFIHLYINDYAEQLNVYAHVWRELRRQRVDKVAIVSTKLPRPLEILATQYSNDGILNDRLQKAIDDWDPVVPVDDFTNKVKEAIDNFAEVVDKIKNYDFQPPGMEKLGKKIKNTNKTFATNVCSNCDVRFTCSSFKEHAVKSKMHKRNLLEHLNKIIEQEELENEINSIDYELPTIDIEDELY